MRRIAREFNQSETTFLLKPAEADADWHLRSFTPTGHEVTGAGHNALGAWWWLAVSGRLPLHDGTTAFRQKIADRVLPLQVVSSGGGVRSIVMQQAAPEFRRDGERYSSAGRCAGAGCRRGIAGGATGSGGFDRGGALIDSGTGSLGDRAGKARRGTAAFSTACERRRGCVPLLPRCGPHRISRARAVLQSDDGDQRGCGDRDRGGAARSVAGKGRSGTRWPHPDRAGLHDGTAKFDRDRVRQRRREHLRTRMRVD